MNRAAAKALAEEIGREFLAGTDIESRDSHTVVIISFTHRKKKQVKQTHRAIKTYLTERGYDDFTADLGRNDGQFESRFVVRS